MTLIGAVLVLMICASANATWMKDLVSPNGLDLYQGLKAKLHDTGDVNATFLQRVSLSVDYGGVGVSVGRSATADDFELNFHVNEVVEGKLVDKFCSFLSVSQ